MALGPNLRYLRKLHGFSQDYIAEKLNYKSFTTIQKWESGVAEPSLSSLRALAEMYQVSLDDLLNRSLEQGGLPTEGQGQIQTIAAHHDSEEWTEEERNEIENFKKYVLSKRQKS